MLPQKILVSAHGHYGVKIERFIGFLGEKEDSFVQAFDERIFLEDAQRQPP